MEQNINDLEAGQIIMVVKNEDGSFSPLGINPIQAIILFKLLGCSSETKPFVVNREVKLVIDKRNGLQSKNRKLMYKRLLMNFVLKKGKNLLKAICQF